MAPKAVSLAFAGRKLTGPPEGYGRKKELQVKRWISGMPSPQDMDPAEVSSVATLAEVEGSKEDLYGSLCDSTDGYGPPLMRLGGNALEPRPGRAQPAAPSHMPKQPITPQSPQPVIALVRPGGLPRSHAGPPLEPSEAATVVGPDETIHASTTTDSSPLSTLALHTGPRSGGAADTPIAAATANDTSTPGMAFDGTIPLRRISQELPPVGASFSRAAPSPTRTLPTSRSGGRAPVLTHTAATAAASGPVGDSLGSPRISVHTPPDLGLTGSLSVAVADGTDADVGLAAAILMARVEATLPQDASSQDKLRAALRLAVEEQQRLQDSLRNELVAVRAIASAARAEAQDCAAEVQAAVRRAVQAEEELGRTRAEALALKQQAHMLQVELEEGREGRDEQLRRAQSDLATALSQLKEHSAWANKVVKESAAEAAAARSMATALQREVAILRRQEDQDKLKMEAVAASLQGALEAERQEVAVLRQERDRIFAQLQAESQARRAAEESEHRALKLAAKQVETHEAVQAAAMAAQAARQRASTAVRRVAVVRAADPSAAAVVEPPARAPLRGVADGSRRLSLRAGISNVADRPQLLAAAAPVPSPLRGKQVVAAPPPSAAEGDAPSPAAAARATGHRALSRGLAAERHQLGELVQLQRRAAAAAELADARASEAALAAAPEHLRLLGLAFRAYIIGSGGPEGGEERPQVPASGKGTGEGSGPAAVLAGRLSSAGYRVYVDPLTLQRPAAQLHEVPSAPLVARAAAAVVIASAGFLCTALARGELCSAARYGCPLVVLSPPDLTLEDLVVGGEPPLAGGLPWQGDSPALQLDLAMDVLREAWPARIALAPDSPAAVNAVAARLGLPDPSLALLPPEVLRHLSVSRTGVMPDLAFLNAPAPTPGSGLAGRGAAAAAGLPGLQHLRLNFGVSEGGGGGGAGVSALVEMLCAVLRGNNTLTALTLRGCPAAAARTITEAVLNSPVSRVSNITVSSRVPVAQLAGRPGSRQQQQQVIELGAVATAGGGDGAGGGAVADVPFTDEDAEVAAAALRARVAAEAADASGGAAMPPLLSLSLPPSCNLRLGAPAVDALIEPLAALSGLQSLNGVMLQAVATAARVCSSAEAAAVSSSPTYGSFVGRSRGGDGGGILDLSGSRCGPVVLALLARQLRSSLAALQALNLTGCETGPVGAARLAETAAASATGSGGGGLTGLQTACLADNGLGPEGIDRILSAIVVRGRGARLTSGGGPGASFTGTDTDGCAILDLSLNALKDAGCKVVARWLPGLAPSLRVLALSHNVIGTEGARALAGALGTCGGLKELVLAGNQLGDNAVRELQSALTRLRGLQVLQLQDNPRISSDGVAALAEALAFLSSLRELDLSRSYAGDEGARQIAKALGAHPALTILALESCKIRAEGAAHLAAALGPAPQRSPASTARGASASAAGPSRPSAPPRLTQLSLARNQMGDRGVSALATALCRNNVLISLDLRNNGVGLAGCRNLGTALRERNITLRLLSMSGNEMEDEALQAIEDMAAASRSLPTRPAAGPPAPSSADGTARRHLVAAAPPAATATPPQRPTADLQPLAGPARSSPLGEEGTKLGDSPTNAAAAGLAQGTQPRHSVTPGGRQLAVEPWSSSALPLSSEQRLLLKVEEAEEKLLLSVAALSAADASLAGAGLVGLGRYGGNGGDAGNRGYTEAKDEEDLEALLSRYRAPPEAQETAMSASSLIPGSRTAIGGALLDLSYTGM